MQLHPSHYGLGNIKTFPTLNINAKKENHLVTS